MEIREQLYEGKAKRVYATDDPQLVVVAYKDDATAFNGLKKGTIAGKGVVNNRMSNLLFQYLADNGIPTHFVEEIDERRTVVKHVKIVPLEVIVRNIAAGSFSKRFGVAEGTELANPTVEYSYKNDELGDPMINTSQALALKLGTAEQIETIRTMALRVNELLSEYFLKRDLILVDYKLEFGLFNGEVILADEISPDTCRLWDVHTREKLDKDRFRRDLGGVEDAYSEVYHRMGLDK
ncbi:MAG: phosphoribosylaminoimidazolesuccinocarboxamide synthase [Candidatus Fimadaptatus sp.]